MTLTDKHINTLVRNLSPRDMTELLRRWLELKDARLMFSLEWKPYNKTDLGENDESIFTIITKDNIIKKEKKECQ